MTPTDRPFPVVGTALQTSSTAVMKKTASD